MTNTDDPKEWQTKLLGTLLTFDILGIFSILYLLYIGVLILASMLRAVIKKRGA